VLDIANIGVAIGAKIRTFAKGAWQVRVELLSMRLTDAQSGRTMAQSKKFWDRIAKRYAKRPVGNEAAYQRKLDTTREYFRHDMEVLEIGCGTGSTAIAHAPYVRHIRATDISDKMVEIASGKADAAGVQNVTFEVVAIEDLDAANETYDAVLALSLLHLLEDRETAITRIHDVLRPGGIFVSNTVCLGDSMRWFRFVAPISRWLGVFPLVRVFTRNELENSLKRAGFSIEHEWQPDKIVVFIIARKQQ
jgi:ubiquinone/menaquinone biosynthesis C-methylase UbiE